MNYVAVLGSEEEFCEIESSREFDKKNLAEQLVRRLKLTTPRKNPEKVKVGVYRLEIVKGQLNRRLVGTYEIQPYLERMTQEEYDVELEGILKGVPEDFRSFVSSMAWEDGHSGGLEEVISIADTIVSGLEPCIEKFKARHKIKKSD